MGNAVDETRGWLSRALNSLRVMCRHRSVLLGGMVTLAFILIAVLGPSLSSHDPYRTNVTNQLEPPSRRHWLGTDDYGRDLLSRIILGSRISMRVGLSVALFTSLGGTALGLVSGYSRRLDAPLMRLMDVVIAFPALLLALAVVAALGPREVNTIVALSIVYLPRTSRIVRGSVIVIRDRGFVEAARGMGAGRMHTIFRHILPNCMAPLLVQGTFVFAMAILGEAALSFLGAGPPPPAPTWGNMIADARMFLRQAPWFSIFPGAAIFLAVMALSFLGDGLRDVLDPQIID